MKRALPWIVLFLLLAIPGTAAAAKLDPLVLYTASLRPVTPYFATVRVDMPTGTARLEVLSTGQGIYVRSPQPWPAMGEHGMMARPAGQVFKEDEETLSSPQSVSRNFRLQVSDGETVLGRQTYKLELIPKWSGSIHRTLLLDRDTLVTLRLEDRDHADALVQRQEVLAIDLNPDLLRFTVQRAEGAGADRVMEVSEAERAIGFKLALPKVLPPGFVLYGVRLSPVHPEVAHLVFTDGVTVVSLFEQVIPWWARLGAGTTKESEHGHQFVRGNLTLFLVGNIPPEELRRMRDSIS
ncbi:MAG: hypothetical protein ACM3UP_01650 [Methanocella sp.]